MIMVSRKIDYESKLKNLFSSILNGYFLIHLGYQRIRKDLSKKDQNLPSIYIKANRIILAVFDEYYEN